MEEKEEREERLVALRQRRDELRQQVKQRNFVLRTMIEKLRQLQFYIDLMEAEY
jgi:SMC interacting uncharacterized protein involved in chromosome segregation